MLVTTTHQIEGRQITDYIQIVAGETILGVNVFKDIAAGLRNIVGGRSQSYEKELVQAREMALAEMKEHALKLGADAVVGVDIAYQNIGTEGSMLMVGASGTAVRLA
ncbi:YbjQ family protein [Corynebacterium felinum]|uniref:UPF0145 protein J2S37_000893 n=1 Tax=Corynebacterium felinum TaxID=131318 RepID=A0ABU2B6X4_9CORY|nr:MULTISPECIES: YbjQ family protein [Corynebacterium]MDF5819778.1 YbjQ family protein [Corynebacterium felinum]MDO4761959.1 YbjQ family protein [Corynebacterium sp.]MDR7354355.1 uncharacterized protein YbjQ (UPF0145 family) [Corynebacterium felinum]